VSRNIGPGRRADDVIGLLDIGTSKVVCVIVSVPQLRAASLRQVEVRVLGSGVCTSRGLRRGTVFERGEAEQAVREAVAQAERKACTAVESVLAAVACGRLRSSTFTADTNIEGLVVEAADIERVMAAARKHVERDGRALLHMNCISYRLDGTGGIGDPHGLAGRTLGADLHAVTADEAPLRNLVHVVERAYLSASSLVPVPYASALAATTGEERHLGVLCLDIGAGTTSCTVLQSDAIRHTAVLPVGGGHVTNDLAAALRTPFAEAERLKQRCGSAVVQAASADLSIEVPGIGGRAAQKLSPRALAMVIEPRAEEMLALVRSEIERAGCDGLLTAGVVLTGGGAVLGGMSELAERVFRTPVRLGVPLHLSGLVDAVASPMYATAVGLVLHGLKRYAQPGGRKGSTAQGTMERARHRMLEWLREFF